MDVWKELDDISISLGSLMMILQQRINETRSAKLESIRSIKSKSFGYLVGHS